MRYFLLFFVLVFTACSVKNYEITQSKIIVIKSPKIKFADIGYVRNTQKSIEVELFSAGRVVDKITINHFVCTSKGCMGKSSFNKEYLSASYPDDILQNIILGHKIYGGKNYLKTKEGFSQYITDSDTDIKYVVTKHEIYFKDRYNGIMLKFKDIDE